MKTLANKKVYVGKHSKEIQEKLFEMGYKWRSLAVEVDNLTRPFLFIRDNLTFYCSDDLVFFNQHCFEEITAEEILAIEVPQKECQFKPFGKVIVRDNDEEEWFPSLFALYDYSTGSKYRTINGYGYRQCIPYEGNEHLVGTTEKAKK